MAKIIVGPGGNNANNGTTYALRKATIDGAEAIAAAGDTIVLSPGVYRMTDNMAVNGSSGNPIVVEGDVLGYQTDLIGGVVRITGSDDDLTPTRANCFTGAKSYRTFRSLVLDLCSDALADGGFCQNMIIEDCVLNDSSGNGFNAASQAASNQTIRRCIIANLGGNGINTNPATVINVGLTIENCLFLANPIGTYLGHAYGVTIRNCMYWANQAGVVSGFALGGGNTIAINQSIFLANTGNAIEAQQSGNIVENYNNLWRNGTPRVFTSVGANSVAVPVLLDFGYLYKGMGLSRAAELIRLSEWSSLRQKAGTGEPTEDILGITRPSTSSKKSWGALQWNDVSRDTASARAGAALKLADAGSDYIDIPVTNASTTVSIYVRREANYAGTLPQMIIVEPGQADRVITDTGSAGVYNLLTTTFTPAAGVNFVRVYMVSLNTATSGSYAVYFDDLSVT